MGKKLILILFMIFGIAHFAYAIPDGAGNDIFTGNVGIGTTLPQTALAILNGNVGIGTWSAAGGALMVQSGNVGIGTLNANQALTVAGIIYSTSGGFQLPDNTVQTTASSGTINSGTINQVAKYAATGNTISGSNILFDDGTNVGIGTAVPSGKFQVNNNALPFYVDSNSNVGIGTTQTSATGLTVMNGKVGIGTWVPGNSLDVVGGNIGIGTTYNLIATGTANTVLTLRKDVSSIYAGWQAGHVTTAGNLQNTAVGAEALQGQTTGNNNTAAGYGALYSLSTGSFDTGVGNLAFSDPSTANHSTGVGAGVFYNENGNYNTCVGDQDMFGTGAAGGYNTCIGDTIAFNISTGQYNTFFGYDAGSNTTTGSYNVGLGVRAGTAATASNSVGIGSYAIAGASNVMVLGGITNTLNVGIGTDMNGANGSLIIISGNVGIGTIQAGTAALTVMNGNVGIGTWAPANSLDVVGGNIGIGTAYNLIGIGTTSTILTLHNDTSSIYLGWQAGANINAGNLQNTVMGYQALYSATNSTEMTAVGYQALYNSTATGYNTAAGWQAMYSNTIGTYDAALGVSALSNNTTGSYNTAVGFDSLYSQASSGASNNTAVGYESLYNISTGQNNTALGFQAGYPGGANGTQAGSDNVWLGANAGPSGTSDVSNSVGIGSFATAGANNVMVLGGMGPYALNVGIGTDMNGASAKLVVIGGNVGIGTITAQAAMVVASGNVGIGTWNTAGGNLIINGIGNVGFGSAFPQAQLDLGTSSTPLAMPGLKASSGTRYLCINTAGVVTSSATACSSGGSPALNGSASTCESAGVSNNPGFTCSFSPAAGDMMVLVISSQNALAVTTNNSKQTPYDNQSDTFVQDQVLNQNNAYFIYIYHVASVASGVTGVTLANSFGGAAVYLLDVKNSVSGGADQGTTNGSSPLTTAMSTGTTSTLNHAVEFAVGGCETDTVTTSSAGPTNGFTGLSVIESGGGVEVPLFAAYLTTASTTGVTTGWTLNSSDHYSCAIQTYY